MIETILKNENQNTNKNVMIRIKNVYGKELIYPVCENANLFCNLTRKKTLDNYDLQQIVNLGYSIMRTF